MFDFFNFNLEHMANHVCPSKKYNHKTKTFKKNKRKGK